MDNIQHESLGLPIKTYGSYIQEEKYLALKVAAQESLKELERLNTFIAINREVIANLKNALV